MVVTRSPIARTSRGPRRAGRLALGCLSAALGTSCTPAPAARPGSGAIHDRPGVSAVARLADDQLAVAQTVYVPITSSVATADNGRPINLAATLFVRNADPKRAIVVDSIRFVDSGGRIVRNFLDRPMAVAPLATLDLFLGESDTTGGASPSFLVDWSADAEGADPVVEAVMISTAGAQGITLSSVGRVVVRGRR